MINDTLQRVRLVLHGSTAQTMDSISYLIGEAEGEEARLADAVEGDKALLLNIDTPEDQYPEIEARIVRGEMDHARLAGAIPRLRILRDEMAKVELAVRQDARYSAIKARCKAILEIVDRAYDETIPQLASALHEYRQLQVEIDVFNNPAPMHTLANPQDRLVKRYKRISQPVPDAVLNSLRLVAKNGETLYTPLDMPLLSTRPLGTIPSVKRENFAPEKEALRQAQEQRPHAQAILRGLENEAEARGISIEQAAMNEGFGAAEIERYREQAEGKQINAAYSALQSAMDKYMVEHAEKTTS